MAKNKAAQISAVIKGILFIGFSIQIILGIVWMCCNFMEIQDFPGPDTVLYGGMFRLFGECAQVMYLLQLAAAFAGGYFFLQSIAPVGKGLAVWRTLALLTFPFAMQCHLALQPHSFVGTLFLLALAFVVRGIRGKRDWWLGLLCVVLLVGMTGVTDKDSRENFTAKGLYGILAERMCWFTLEKDYPFWSDELQEIVAEDYRQARFYPDNMWLLLDSIREAVGEDAAKEYYKEMVGIVWDLRRSEIVREMAWDVLGYTFTPIGARMLLDGEAYYDSYTGRNFENMRNAYPRLTQYYVDYESWWFGVAVVLAAVGSAVLLVDGCLTKKSAGSAGLEIKQTEKKERRKNARAVLACLGVAAVWVLVFTMRGAAVMDYKWTIAVNQLWITWGLLVIGEYPCRMEEGRQ